MLLEHCLITGSKIIGKYALKEICTKNMKIKANHKYNSVGVNVD
jgi:Holliday junction resolvasome RuvABC ATP-dependent DNA helicase subunit